MEAGAILGAQLQGLVKGGQAIPPMLLPVEDQGLVVDLQEPGQLRVGLAFPQQFVDAGRLRLTLDSDHVNIPEDKALA